MNIPPKADTVIVFTSILALVLVDYVRRNSIHLVSIEGCGDALLIAVLSTVGFVIGCAVCRFLARRFLNNTNLGHVRAFSNATFCVLLMSAIFVLIPPTYTTRARIWIPTSPDPGPDTPSHQQ
jgi:hypothetical protein